MVGILSAPAGQELADAAGRDVAAFECVLVNLAAENEGRTIVLEVGDHGLSLRDPYGALLKVVPLEYITAWNATASSIVLLISKDLQNFRRMMCQTAEGAAIQAALVKVANERVALALPPTKRSSISSRIRRSVLGPKQASSHSDAAYPPADAQDVAAVSSSSNSETPAVRGPAPESMSPSTAISRAYNLRT